MLASDHRLSKTEYKLLFDLNGFLSVVRPSFWGAAGEKQNQTFFYTTFLNIWKFEKLLRDIRRSVVTPEATRHQHILQYF